MRTARNAARALATLTAATALVLAGLVGVAPAEAATSGAAVRTTATTSPAPTPAPGSPASPTPEGRMGQYPASAFASAAAQLPSGLVAAVQRDLHLSAADYLAQAAAGVDAAATLATLKGEGVHVRGSRLVGTSYVVNVDSDTDAAAVTKLGAVADLGPVSTIKTASSFLPAAGTVYNGSGWFWENTDTEIDTICSVGYTGYQSSTGAAQAVTAGHCFEDYASSSHGSPRQLSVPTAGDFDNGSDVGALGELVSGSNQFGNGEDSALISDPTVTQKAATLTWGGGGGAPLGSTPTPVYDLGAATVGAPVCKSGVRSGWSCGSVTDVDAVVAVGGESVNTIVTTACVLPGDSGGPLLSGGFALGVISATTGSNCSADNYASAAFPMVSVNGDSVVSQHTDWEPAVTVPTPIIAAPAPGGVATSIVGSATASGASGSRLKASVYLDGSSTAFATVSAPHGAFSIPLTGVSTGTHSYVVKEVWESRSSSATVSGTFRKIGVSRIAGADRYVNADLIAKQAYPSGAGIVYIANGQNYPDALSAGPVAVHDGAPILLTTPTSLPSDVVSTIQTLNPNKIIVLGGVNSVSNAVLTQLKTLVDDPSDVGRIGGTDRIDTSSKLALRFGTASTVFVSNGFNFPDALSAGPAAVTKDAPVLLVNGAASSLPASTLQLFDTLGTTKVVITGGTASVSSGIESQLKALFGSADVQRVGGADRFATSLNINKAFFSSASGALISTGENFPDALTGGAWAGALSEPLFTVHHDCIPSDTSQELAALGVSSVTLLGGTSALNATVAALQHC